MRAPLTSKGALRLRLELEELKSVKRPAVIAAIAEARAHGDLKENAEYHAARDQQIRDVADPEPFGRRHDRALHGIEGEGKVQLEPSRRIRRRKVPFRRTPVGWA